MTQWKGIKFGKNYVYPGWAEGLGWMLALVSMICIPIGMIYVVYTASRTRNSFSPNDTKKDWRTVRYILFGLIEEIFASQKNLQEMRNLLQISKLPTFFPFFIYAV